ncbi:MAG: hypothetical protein ACTSPI_02750 [Candidatus Heimdallarchaeaceae archaeon]
MFKLKNEIKEKIMRICKGEKSEQQFEKLKEKFLRLYNKLDDEFSSDYMKQKFVLNVLIQRFGRLNWWKLNSVLGIKNYWEIEV